MRSLQGSLERRTARTAENGNYGESLLQNNSTETPPHDPHLSEPDDTSHLSNARHRLSDVAFGRWYA